MLGNTQDRLSTTILKEINHNSVIFKDLLLIKQKEFETFKVGSKKIIFTIFI